MESDSAFCYEHARRSDQVGLRQRWRKGCSENPAYTCQVASTTSLSGARRGRQRVLRERDGDRSGTGPEAGILLAGGADSAELLREALPLHYRFRFHPLGPDEDERRELAAVPANG